MKQDKALEQLGKLHCSFAVQDGFISATILAEEYESAKALIPDLLVASVSSIGRLTFVVITTCDNWEESTLKGEQNNGQ